MRETLIYLSHLDHDDTEKQVCELESSGSVLFFKGDKLFPYLFQTLLWGC